jgi:hypothetical protein
LTQIFPKLSDHELSSINSRAEVALYKLLRDQLDDSYLVIFQPRWILKRESSQARDGETDFLIAHPDNGFFCLEVKGGGIHFNGSDWSSIDKNQNEHEIRNPIKQSMDAKYAIRSKLIESSRVTEDFKRVPIGHSVFFPDMESAKPFIRTDLPLEIIGAKPDLFAIKKWVDQVLNYWSGDRSDRLGKSGISQLIDALVRPIQVEVKLGTHLVELEERRARLTEDQIRILDFLETRRRVAISGGAGTGKTVIAIEKAKRLANDGFKTLFTCYNRELSNYISSQIKNHPNLTVTNFDRLSDHFVSYADNKLNRGVLAQAKATYPNADLWRVQMPAAMTYAMDYIDERFDAIVVDEAQDFPEEYWFPLEYLLTDFQQGPFYIFYDTHQNLYRRKLNFPIAESPYTLSKNCRNTSEIHSFAYKKYVGPLVQASELRGLPVEKIEASGLEKQATEIHKVILELVLKKGIRFDQIVVLIGDSMTKKDKYSILGNHKLPLGGFWSVENGFKKNQVLIDTVKRFKGLEAEIVLIWGLPEIASGELDEILYVGASRAKSQLLFIGSREELMDV